MAAGIVCVLENPGKVELELTEVQSGSYLGEDDIVRINNIYGHSEIIDISLIKPLIVW